MKYLNETKVAYFYTFIILILFAVPTYFALSFALDKEVILKKTTIENYTKEIEQSIFSNKIPFTESVKIKYALFDQRGNKMFSNMLESLPEHNFISYSDYPYLYYKKDINYNVYGISYIIAQIEINYYKVLFIASIIFVIILVNIYILNKVIIKNTARPYEIMQSFMNTFFNDTMHELKTPLGILNINLDLLIRKIEANKYTQRMKTALKQMQLTYEDIEYYIKNKNVNYVKTRVDLSEYTISRAEYFEDLAIAKEIEINVDIGEQIYVFINILELQRIIDNTLSNAIKYSDSQKKINITLHKDDDFAYLTIKDNGHGIYNVKKVFERFVREDETQGGFGLGQGIIKNICNKNDITISIDSTPNIGSTFSYRFAIYKMKLLDKVDEKK